MIYGITTTKTKTMIDNIKGMLSRMIDESKQKAFTTLSQEFKVSESHVKNVWLYGNKLPEKYQAKTVGIFQNIILLQEQKTKEIANIEVTDPREVKTK